MGATPRAWPDDQSWSWTFPLPDQPASNGISLRLRQKSMPLRPRGTTPTVGRFEKAMAPAEASRAFGTATVITSAAPAQPFGTVSVQLIDLAEIGAAPTTPGKSLRVLAKLSVAGTETKLSSEDTILPDGRFAGRSIRNEGTWIKGELYLMSFWIESEHGITRYDALLEQQANRSSQ